LLTVSRSRQPSASKASMSLMGTPHRPNPPTARDDPSPTSNTASAGVANVLSMPVILLACVLVTIAKQSGYSSETGGGPRDSLARRHTDSIQADGSRHGDSGVRGGDARDHGAVYAGTTSLRSVGELDLVGA